VCTTKLNVLAESWILANYIRIIHSAYLTAEATQLLKSSIII